MLNSVLTTDAGLASSHSAAIYGMYVSVHRAGGYFVQLSICIETAIIKALSLPWH